MKFTIHQLKRRTYNEPFEFEEDVDVSELASFKNDIRRIGQAHVSGYCTMQGEQLMFTLTITGKMILPCARTLVDVDYPYTIEANETFTLSEYHGKWEEENEVHPISGEILDLTPYIKENILLEVPFRVFSDNDDAGKNVPIAGEGWDFVSEEDHESDIDPRLKKLGSLFHDNKKEQ